MKSGVTNGRRATRWDSWSNAVLLVLFLFFIFNALQSGYDRYFPGALGSGPAGNAALLSLAFALTAAVCALLFTLYGLWPKAMGFLKSMRLGVTLLAAILLSTALATLVLQNASQQEYTDAYPKFLFDLFRATHLTDIIGSLWFSALLLLLVINLVACTVARRPWSLPMLGFLMAHLGAVLVIGGAFIGAISSEQGVLVLGEGDSSSWAMSQEYAESATRLEQLFAENVPEQHRIDLGAQVRLTEFEQLFYDDPFAVGLHRAARRLNVQTGEEEAVSRPVQQMRFDSGQPLVLADGLGRLSVTRIFRNLKRETTLETAEQGKPLARIERIFESHAVAHVLDETTLARPVYGNSWRLSFAWTEPDPERLESLGFVSDRSPYVLYLLGEDGNPEPLPLEPGNDYPIGTTGFSVRMDRFFHDLKVDLSTEPATLANGSELLAGPAIRILVSGGGLEGETALVIPHGARAAHSGVLSTLAEAGVELAFALSPLENLLLIGDAGGGQPALKIWRYGREPEVLALEPGLQYTPVRSPEAIRFGTTVASGRVGQRLSDDADEPNPAVEVQVQTGAGTRSAVLECESLAPRMQLSNNPERYRLELDDRNWIALTLRVDAISDWRSHVEVGSGGQEARTAVIEVNEPLVQNGFYYYQSSFYAERGGNLVSVGFGQEPDKWYTYLTVRRDPGLWIVYLGLGLVVAGIAFTLYIKPRLRARSEADYVD